MLASSLSILLSGCSNTLPTASSPVHKRDVAAIPKAPSSMQNSSIEMSQAEDSDVLFFCTTTQNKFIEVYDFGDTIQYSYSPENEPEIVLNVSRNQASTYQWAGVGRSMNYSIDIPNQDTIYQVFWSQDRLTEGLPISAGVNVLIKDEYVTTVDCAGGDIINNLIGVDLNPSY